MNHLRNKPALASYRVLDGAHSSRLVCFVGTIILAICLIVGMCPLPSFADTEQDLAAAKEKYEEVQSQLDSIANQYAALSKAQSDTLNEIEQVEKQIQENEEQLTELQDQAASHQGELSKYVVETYRNDSADFVGVLLGSSSFEDFVTNFEYVSLIYEKKASLIQEVQRIAAGVEKAKAGLEVDRDRLDSLRSEQTQQLAEMKKQQEEATELLANLDTEVKELTEKNNAELAARAAEAQAQTNAEASGEYYIPAENVVRGSGSAAAVVSSCYSTPSPGLNWCAAWVTNVFSGAGIGSFYGDACDMYNAYCYSSDRSELQPGMIIAVSSYPQGGSAGIIYGHVGIYIGDGMVMENIGSITQTPLDRWISTYGSAVTPRWGWLGGIELS